MEQHILYTLLLNNLTTAVLLINDELNIEYINPAAEALLKVSGSRALGQPLARYIDLEDDAWQVVLQTLREGVTFTQRQAMIDAPGHQHTMVDYIATPVDLDNSGRIHVMVEMQPVDRLLRIAREESLISNQATSRSLIRGLAHEIKNPLGGLRGAAQLLASELDSAELRDYTEVIIEEADRLRNLVDRMLGPRKPLQRANANIHEVLERVVTLIHVENSQRIQFDRDYDPSIPDIAIDREQMIQAVLNVIRNAMEALQSAAIAAPKIGLKTRVLRQFTIGTERHRLVCCIEITDNGPGIAEDIRESLFMPMISGRPDGTGLGLSITQSILNQHQGLVECDTVEGLTRFSMYLPLETINDQ
ncbi:MAG TPA: nitrogen regulation protein NR(II) [Pseudomonadales bacterium]|nr:nitrogen regulation protein NR(II) [Pseudomonadales bacterium]